MNIEELLQKAKAEPPKEDRFNAIMPVIQILRDDKEYTWGEIQQWLIKETKFNHSADHWRSKYINWKAQQKKHES